MRTIKGTLLMALFVESRVVHHEHIMILMLPVCSGVSRSSSPSLRDNNGHPQWLHRVFHSPRGVLICYSVLIPPAYL
jgi:hypothetical protein